MTDTPELTPDEKSKLKAACASSTTEAALRADPTHKCIDACWYHGVCDHINTFCLDNGGLISATTWLDNHTRSLRGLCISETWKLADFSNNPGEMMKPEIAAKVEKLCADYDFNPFPPYYYQNIGRGTGDRIITEQNIDAVRDACGCFANKKFTQQYIDAVKKQGADPTAEMQNPMCWWNPTCSQLDTAIPRSTADKQDCPPLSILNCFFVEDYDKDGAPILHLNSDSAFCQKYKMAPAPPNKAPPATPPAPGSSPPKKTSLAPPKKTPLAAARVSVPLIVGLSIGTIALIAAILFLWLRKTGLR